MQNVYKETMKKIINKQADILFHNLSLEPGFDIRETVLQLGGKVEPVKLGENIYAKISPTKDNSFEIQYDSSVEDDVYLRFSIAHELGHLFLHMAKSDADKGYVIVGDYKRQAQSATIIEWEAEEFAAAFLMPESIFRVKVDEVEAKEEVRDKIEWLAELFKVPYKSVITRGKSLEIW